MLTNEELNNSDAQENKDKEEQFKITPEPSPAQQSPIQPVPTKEAKPKEVPEIKEKKPEQKPKKEKRQKKIDVLKEKFITINGKKVLMVPSGFEIKTADGWKPIMMQADKIIKSK